MPQWFHAGCARLVQYAAATIPGALKLLPAVSFPRSRRCSHRRRVSPLRRTQRPECLAIGRFSSDYVWPVLGDYRGNSEKANTVGAAAHDVCTLLDER